MSAECIVNELMSSEVNLSFKAKLMLHHDVWEEEGKMDLLSLDENDVKRPTSTEVKTGRLFQNFEFLQTACAAQSMFLFVFSGSASLSH